MSDKENYFPPNATVEQINDTLYTDYGFLSSPNDLGDDLFDEAYKHIAEEENGLESDDVPF